MIASGAMSKQIDSEMQGNREGQLVKIHEGRENEECRGGGCSPTTKPYILTSNSILDTSLCLVWDWYRFLGANDQGKEIRCDLLMPLKIMLLRPEEY